MNTDQKGAVVTQQDSWLRSILQDPNNLDLRRVYADWLQEQGMETEAEFVRVQCELAVCRQTGKGRRAQLEKRDKALFRKVVADWPAPLPSYLAADPDRLEGGFVQRLQLDTTGMTDADVKHLASHPALALLPWLAQHGRLQGEGAFRLVAACPHLAALAALDFSHHELRDEAVLDLLRSPYLSGLTALHLGFCFITDAAVTAIASAPALAALRTLDLGGDTDDGYASNEITSAGAAAIANSPHLAGLTTLSLFFNFDVGDAGLAALAGSRHLKQVTTLDLSGTGLTDKGVRRLASSDLLGGLRVLRLWNNNDLTDAAAQALAGAPKCAGLEELDLRGFRDIEKNGMGDPAARALARSPHLGNLRRLRAGNWVNLTEKGASALSACFGDRLDLERARH
jgi:uncharacterized protein (TIGR02996 family)